MANLRSMEELRMGRYFEQDQHALRSVICAVVGLRFGRDKGRVQPYVCSQDEHALGTAFDTGI